MGLSTQEMEGYALLHTAHTHTHTHTHMNISVSSTRTMLVVAARHGNDCVADDKMT